MKSWSVCLFYFLPAQAAAADIAPQPWSNNTEVSIVNTTGNSRTQTLKAADNFKKEWPRALLELQGSALGSSDRNTVTAEEYNAAEKIGWKFTERDYLFQKEAWQKNRFAGIRMHVESTAGYGRKLIQNAFHQLTTEIGSGYVNEDRTDGSSHNYAAGRAYSQYTVHLSSTSHLTQDVEYLPKWKDASDYRLTTETALVASVMTHLSLKISYEWKRVNRPPAGFGQDDTMTSAALVINY